MSVTTVETVAESAADVAALIPRYSWELMSEGQRDELMVGVVLPRYMKTTNDGVQMGPKWWGELVGAGPHSVKRRIQRLQIKEKSEGEEGHEPVCEQEWSDEERALRAQLEEGLTVVVHLGRHRDLVTWAEVEGLLVKIDRTTIWGNVFKLDEDGTRDEVIANYRDHYLPFKPSLLERLTELEGKALGCWCAPEPCHGDVLKARI